MGLPHKKMGSPLAPLHYLLNNSHYKNMLYQLNYKLYVFSKFSITCLRFFPKSG